VFSPTQPPNLDSAMVICRVRLRGRRHIGLIVEPRSLSQNIDPIKLLPIEAIQQSGAADPSCKRCPGQVPLTCPPPVFQTLKDKAATGLAWPSAPPPQGATPAPMVHCCGGAIAEALTDVSQPCSTFALQDGGGACWQRG